MRLLLALLLSADPGPTVRLCDEGGPCKAVRELRCRGAGINCDAGTSTFGTITVEGAPSAGCPAGFVLTSDGGVFQCISYPGQPGAPPLSLQYNCPDGGGFCGAQYLFSDGGHLGMVPVTTAPAAPAADGQLTFAYQWAANGPIYPTTINSTTKSPMSSGASGVFDLYPGSTTWEHYVCSAAGYNAVTLGCNEEGIAPGGGVTTAIGATLVATAFVANSSWIAQQKRLCYRGVAPPGLADTSGGNRFNILHLWRGNCTNCGGFIVQSRVGFLTVSATQRVMVGVYPLTGAPTATVDPSTYGDVAYAGADAADTNLGCCSHGAFDAGVATCQTLGASFPKALEDAGYDVTISAAPNASQVECTVCSRPTGVCATKVMTSDLPTNTQLLTWINYANTGNSVSSNSICWIKTRVAYGTGP